MYNLHGQDSVRVAQAATAMFDGLLSDVVHEHSAAFYLPTSPTLEKTQEMPTRGAFGLGGSRGTTTAAMKVGLRANTDCKACLTWRRSKRRASTRSKTRPFSSANGARWIGSSRV